MKKIGILFGKESSFPYALIERINAKKIPNIVAEAVTVDKVAQGDPTEYAVIIDRISQDVPFYRAYLKNAALCGTAVINNPFWWSADEKFFNNALAVKIGVPVPNTVVLPSKNRPDDTSEMSFRNLQHPLSWDAIFKYIGFPAYMKPHSGGGWKHVYKIESPEDFFKKYAETGQLVMMLQSEVQFDEYFRCYCLGGNRVHIMQYDPRNPHEARYVKDGAPVSKELLAKVEDYTLKLNRALGYDFNTVEFGVQNGIPYAIDFCNPAPDADLDSVGKDNFEWVVENAAMMAIERARIHRDGQNNLTWGTFVKNAIAGYAPNIPNPVWGGVTREVREVSDIQRPIVNPVTSSIVQPIAPSSPFTTATRTSTMSSTTTRTVTQPTETVNRVTTTVVQPVETVSRVTTTVVQPKEIVAPVVAKAVPKEVVAPVVTQTVETVMTKTVAQPKETVVPKTVVQPKETVVPKTVVQPKETVVPKTVVQPKETVVPKIVAQPKETVATKTVVQPTETVVVATKDDLKKIEGIGPKIEELLHTAGIMTFAQLSVTPQQTLQEILDVAGKRFAMHDPTSWTLQANLASKNDWEALKQLQAQLIGGKAK
jgi:predicted flap endonuclease-1-like 5' DNA nuclease/glutathione synthase/RimK-type ligase-like ATP-grasp enzyme